MRPKQNRQMQSNNEIMRFKISRWHSFATEVVLLVDGLMDSITRHRRDAQLCVSTTKHSHFHVETDNYPSLQSPNKFGRQSQNLDSVIGVKVSQATGQKAAYTKNKGLNKQYYLDMILTSINQHKYLTRRDIDELLWDKLPDIYNDKQKKIKITNLIAELRQKGKITNHGTFAFPQWKLL